MTRLFAEWMSRKLVEYLSYSNCQYNLIGKNEKRHQIAHIGRILVLEVTHIWISLKCGQIQDERVYIREVREN